MGSFVSRTLIMALGYAYPAYQCFKQVDKKKPDIEELLFWCQYWCLVAIFTVGERTGDALISWFPMYSEAKLAFLIYLWYPRTKGASYVYNSFFQPLLIKHEADIDIMLLKLRAKSGDIAVLFWKNVASYGQTRFFDIMHYVSSQSSTLHPDQQEKRLNNDKPPVSSQEDEHSVLPETETNHHEKMFLVQSTKEEEEEKESAGELKTIHTVAVIGGSLEKVKTNEAVEESTTSSSKEKTIHLKHGIWRFFHAKGKDSC